MNENEPVAEPAESGVFDLADRIEDRRAADVAEQHREEAARKAGSLKAVAGRALGMKEKEITSVRVWGKRLLATVRGTRFVIAGPEAPDATGRFGALPADKDLPGKPRFAALPGEPVPPPEVEPRVRWPKLPRRPKPAPVPSADEAAARAAAAYARRARRIDDLREELAELDVRLSAGEADHGHNDLRVRRAALFAEIKSQENQQRTYELELNPPPPDPWQVTLNRAALAWGRVIVAGGSRGAAIEASGDHPQVSTWPTWTAAREIEGAEQWLRHHGLDLDEEES